MKISEVLTKTTQFFKDKNYSSPRLDIELLICHQLKWDRVKLYMNFEYPLAEGELESLRAMVKRRGQGEPIAYIIEERYFYKSRFIVKPGVLIPRPETELLVEEALLEIGEDREGTILDLGSGTGCIGLSILLERPKLKLIAFDQSPTAVQLTEENARELGVFDRVEVRLQDLNTHPILREGESIEVIAAFANPPYIDIEDSKVEANVKKFEPHEALFSIDRGLFAEKSWQASLAKELREEALVIFELGQGQHDELKSWAEQNGYKFKKFIKDYAGITRHLVLTR